jgi:hypothetical protein
MVRETRMLRSWRTVDHRESGGDGDRLALALRVSLA